MFDCWQVSGRHKGAQQFAIPAAIAMLAHLPGVEKPQQKMALLVKCRDLVGDFRDAPSRPRQGVVKLVGGAGTATRMSASWPASFMRPQALSGRREPHDRLCSRTPLTCAGGWLAAVVRSGALCRRSCLHSDGRWFCAKGKNRLALAGLGRDGCE